MKNTRRKRENIYPSCYEAIKLTAINLYTTSHLANEVLNETDVQNQVLLDIYRYTVYLPEIKQRTETKTQQVMSALLYHRQHKRTINISLNYGMKHYRFLQ